MRSFLMFAVVTTLGCGSSDFTVANADAAADADAVSEDTTTTTPETDVAEDTAPVIGEIGPTPEDALGPDSGLDGCVDGTYGSHRYRACHYNSNWNKARLACAAFEGYQLVSIETAGEQDYVDRLLAGRGIAWLGLSDSALKGTFRWVSGAPLDYANWASGEPKVATSANCGQMFATGLWYDADCGGGAGYIICESK